MRAHRRERSDPLGVEPSEKRAHGDRIGGAGVRDADVGGEEVEKPQRRGLALGRDQRRHQRAGGRRREGHRRFDDCERLARLGRRVLVRTDCRLPTAASPLKFDAHAAPVFLISVFWFLSSVFRAQRVMGHYVYERGGARGNY